MSLESVLAAVKDELMLPGDLAPDLAGLRLVYSRWCAHMTFDNMRKLVSLRRGDARLAGGDAEDYFTHWLEHRTGGTCWPSSNALFTLVSSYGFEARRVAGSMYDMPAVNHGSTEVRIDGSDWLLDSSMLTGEPIRLANETLVKETGPVRYEIEPRDGTHLIWTDYPPREEFIPCRLREDNVGHDYYLERYESSREMSPFNEKLYFRRVNDGEMLSIIGNTRFRRLADGGIEAHTMEADELIDLLETKGGVSRAFIQQWIDVGALESTMDPNVGHGPAFPETEPRPSRR